LLSRISEIRNTCLDHVFRGIGSCVFRNKQVSHLCCCWASQFSPEKSE